ncbi:MAG TPA: serine/threonine-protein kinase [Spirochaetia bacterium]|nr:serine/threonine-protein kinase [Spirochaetia bacterium]
MDKQPPRTIGKYELIGKIAQGGMGTLYKARHPTLDRVVLLKKLTLRGGEQVVERFRREARLMMDFKDERIVQVYDHFKAGQHYFIVEEYVDGMSLDQLIRRERYLGNDAITVILYEVCKALKYAHDKQVIHRDIKPANILLSKQGEVKLADFGIATSREETEDGLTQDGTMLGTPAYVPPEQLDDARNVDIRADIYSLGVVLYEMLTGHTPYPGSFTAETIRLIHRGKYTAIRRLNPKASRLLARIARVCMRPKRRRRYQDLGQVLRILERRIKRRDPASLRKAVQRVLNDEPIQDVFRARRWWAVWLGAAVTLAAVGAAGAWYAGTQGFWLDVFAANRYGALVVAAQVDSVYKGSGQVFFEPVLYREQNGSLTALSSVGYALRENTAAGSGSTFLIESKRLFLPAGRYRLKASLENQLYWTSFVLSPRTDQRKVFSTADALHIVIRQPNPAPQPLEVRYRAVDADTAQELADAQLSVFLFNAWLPWSVVRVSGLSTGRSYRFRVEHDGYRPQIFDLAIKPYQTILTIEAHLARSSGAASSETSP